MGRIKRYRTALSRHHRSRGFGIHSPFAFNFVRYVLREKNPYYSYELLEALRQAVIDDLRGGKRHKRVISFKDLKMLFRIANHFNPSCMLQVGTCYGLTAVSLLSVSSASRLWIYEPEMDAFPVVGKVLMPHLDRVDCYDDLSVATGDYSRALGADGIPFMVINSMPVAGEVDVLRHYLDELLKGDCVIVMRDLNNNGELKRLWRYAKDSMTHGQSFSNEKISVLVVNRRLNLEHFFLWF